MLQRVWARLRVPVAALATVTFLSGVTAAQPTDPTVLADVSTPARAAGSFLFVLGLGGALLTLSEGFVDRSIDAAMETPLRSIVYGVIAQVGVVFIGVFALSQIASVGVGGPVVGVVGSWIIALAWLALAGLGFTVVGAGLTDAAGERQPWPGVAIGAAIAAFVWVLPTFSLGLLAWVLVASVGIGGPTKRWLHASMDGDTTADADV